jgi:hypothetical protein
MDASKEIRKIIAKYRKFDAQAFRLLKKMTGLESGYESDTALHRESIRLCEDIEDLLSRLRRRTNPNRPADETRGVRSSIKPSLRHWIHMMRSRRSVMDELRWLDKNAEHERNRQQKAQPSLR